MALNNLGLGFMFTAKDAASGIMARVRQNFVQTEGVTSAAAAAIGKNFATFSTGMAITGVGLGGLAALSGAIGDAKDFSKAIALVATEADSAKFSTEAMRDVTLKLAGTYGKMPVDEAEALYKAVALGADDASKATFIMTAANKLAVAGNSELKTTMDALGGTLNAYHLAAADAGPVSDAFFIAMKNGNTTVQDLASSVGRVNAGAYEMGIKVEEVLGSLSVMTNKGVQASEAVSMLHGALANITHPSHDAKAEAQRLGIAFNAAAVRAKGFIPFLHSITDNAKFNKDTLAKLFTSVEGSNAMAMLAGDMGAVDSVMKAMHEETGATTKGFEIMANTLAYQEQRMDALKKTASVMIGEALEPSKLSVVDLGNRFLQAFTNMSKGMRGFLVRGVAMLATVLVIVGGTLALVSAVGMLSAGLAAAGVSMSGFLLTILPVTLAIGAAVAAFIVFREAYDQNLGGFADFFDDIYNKVRLTFQALVQVFSTGAFSGSVLKELENGNGYVEEFVVRVYVWANRIKNFFQGIADAFFGAVEGMKPTFQAFMASLEQLGFSFFSLYDAVDPRDARNKFESFGATGRTVGAALAKAVEVGIKLATAFVDLVVAVKPLVGGFLSLVGAVASSELAMGALKLALVAYTSFLVAQALVAMADLGFAAANTAVRLALMASSMNISSVAGVVAGIRGIAAAATAANLSILPLAAAIGALYLAYQQWEKLKSEWSSDSGHQIWEKFKNDIGYTRDADYMRARGTYSEADDDLEYKEHQRKLFAEHGTVPSSADGHVLSGRPPPSPVMATMPPEEVAKASYGPEVVDAIETLSSSISGQPIVVPVTLMMPDGEVLARANAKGGRSDAGRSFTPSGGD